MGLARVTVFVGLLSCAVLVARAQDVGSGVVLRERPLVTVSTGSGGNFIFQSAASFTLMPISEAQLLAATVLDAEGNEVRRLTSLPTSGGTASFSVGGLAPGYYLLSVSARRGAGNPQSLVQSFAIVSAPPFQPELRFGIDAALSWYGGSDEDVDRAIYAMSMAGVGTVRDRLSWTKVAPRRDNYAWGRFGDVARRVKAAGLDQVTVFHDSPPWTRPNDPPSISGDRKPSLSNEAVREFGRAFALDLGRYVSSVEYWNEQNGDFFAGTPLQYVNGLRAFAAGVWSVNSSIAVLIGAASNSPGRFFEEVYKNRIADSFSIRNQHYYGSPDEFFGFYSREVSPVDKAAGVAAKAAWLTEAGYGLKPDGNGDRSASERAQAVHLVKTYATAFAVGYQRVYYFFLRELMEEGRNNWGILNSDFSPRPAYVALANLTRQLNGRPFAGYVLNGSSFAGYFGTPKDGYVAITWGMAVGDLGGLPDRVFDMFGRPVRASKPGPEPIFVEGIRKLPASFVRPVASSAGAPTLPPVLIEGELAGGGSGGAHVTELPIPQTGEVSLKLRLSRLGNLKGGRARITCEGGFGIAVSTPAFDVELPKIGDVAVAECRYISSLRAGARSAVGAIVASDVWSGRTYASVVAIPRRVAREGVAAGIPNPGPPFCTQWRSRSSPVVQSAVKSETPRLESGCDRSFVVTSRVVAPGDGWVFPIADMPSRSSRLVGLEFESSSVQGQSYPPKPLIMQVVDSAGAIWVLPLDSVRQPDGSFSHEAMFARAMVAPWSKVKSNEPLEVAAIKQISIGYAGGGTKPGDIVAFRVTDLRGVEGR